MTRQALDHRHRLELVQPIEGRDQGQRQARRVIICHRDRLEAVACPLGAALAGVEIITVTRSSKAPPDRL